MTLGSLTEAIALGHDLGHTPFGHAGERVLNELTGSFEHNVQSLVGLIQASHALYFAPASTIYVSHETATERNWAFLKGT